MFIARSFALACIVLFGGVVLLGTGSAHAQSAEAMPQTTPAAPPVEPQPTYGQLVVRMGLPPGTPHAALFLNDTFIGWLASGVLPAPLGLLPGGYSVRVTAPGLRSYDTAIQLAPGQVIELQGALVPEVTLIPPVPMGTAPLPIAATKPTRSAGQTYRAVIWGIGLTALGLAVVAGIATGIACGAGKCKSSRSHDD